MGVAALAALPVSARWMVDEPKTAAALAKAWKDGALTGQVLDSASGKPVGNATVALRDKSGTVIAWTTTDPEGRYTLATDSLKALQLKPSRRRGLLERMAHGVGSVVAAPVKIVAGAVKQVDPINTAKAGIVATVTANPVPIAAQVAASTAKTLSDQTRSRTRERTARTVLGERAAVPKEKRKGLAPGEVSLIVAAPGFKSLQGTVGAFWLEPPAAPLGVAAHLETVHLAPISSEKKSEVENIAVLLSDGALEPTLVPSGATVHVTVRLATPAQPALRVRVFARENKRRTVAELLPVDGSPGVYAGYLSLDPRLKSGDTVVTLVALRAEPIEVDVKDSALDPLVAFARDLDELDPGKPYAFDLRIMASENRLELPLTVLDPKQAAPSLPPH
jgi:hypothetical protein